MGARVFFHAENVIVSSLAVTVGNKSYAVAEVSSARSRRIRRWFRDSFELRLTLRDRGEETVLTHRNGYFVFQLVNAIESALNANSDAPSAAQQVIA